MKMSEIPTERDWRSEPWSLDISYAYKHFAGKSIDEVVTLFEEHPIYYQEDIVFMPVACFRYYLNAYMRYLLSDASRGDSDGASCFIAIIDSRHGDLNSCDSNTRSQVSAVLDRLANSQEWYEADEDIYGDFRKRVADLDYRG